MPKITLVRHAKTDRKQGVIDPNYSEASIQPFNPDAWVRSMESSGVVFRQDGIISSPVKRCQETSFTLHKALGIPVMGFTPNLKEFEITGLDKPLQDTSEDEFNAVCKISPADMAKQAESFMKMVENMAKEEGKRLFYTPKEYIYVSHGTFICYLIWFLTGHKDKSLYDVLTSDDIFVPYLGLAEIEFDDDWNYESYRIVVPKL